MIDPEKPRDDKPIESTEELRDLLDSMGMEDVPIFEVPLLPELRLPQVPPEEEDHGPVQ